MPEIQYPKNPNSDTAFVVQEDGTKNRALMTAPQDTSSLELPTNSNSCKGYVTVDGKKQRVILTADIGSGGGGASYTAGTGIDITSGVISVTAPTLTNIATQSGSLVVGDNAQSLIRDSTAYGANTIGFGRYGAAFGKSAVAKYKATALGANTTANEYTIQLGQGGTNSDAGTMKVALTTSSDVTTNYELMSADGTVPTARLTKVNTTATLAAGSANWTNNEQTVTVSGVKADSVVFVSPAPASASDYASAGILCTAQAADSLTFTCTTTPSNAITVNVVCL